MKLLKIIVLILAFTSFKIQCMQENTLDLRDEIDFFNVGQGHAVLINKVGYVPLLIDAGATAHPYVADQKFEWNKGDSKSPISKASSISKISRRILEFWQSSNNTGLRGGNFSLNIIITHPDDDHLSFVPTILSELVGKSCYNSGPSNVRLFSFSAFALLGGQQSKYPNQFLDDYPIKKIYTGNFQGNLLSLNGQCGLLDNSGCISHLFCPRGIPSDDNRWSIITRIEIKGLSAILTGDADSKVKEQMLNCLIGRERELESDILLVPHHGAEKTYNNRWDHFVNPRAIIIGAAPNQQYCHPKGETVLELLSLYNGNGRLWKSKVRAHGIQYHSTKSKHEEIQTIYQNQGERLFDVIPNVASEKEGLQPTEQWQVAWVDLPIYTLWTTGTLYFIENIEHPIFAEAPSGLMNYVAVSQPGYLFSPHVRNKLEPLSDEEQQLYRGIATILQDNHGAHWEMERRGKENALLKEMLSIEKQDDRLLYLNFLYKILNGKTYGTDGHYRYSTLFFKWIREAVIIDHPLKEERLQKAIELLMAGNTSLYKELHNDSLRNLCSEHNIFLFAADLDDRAYILKTYLKSNHPIESLGRYISAYNVPAGADMDILCPFGFPEWLQLKILLDFFEKEIPNDESYPMGITDILDITHLRCEGKNFKEIAKALVEEGIEIQKLGYKYQIEEKGLTESDISPETPEDLALYLQEMNLTDGGGKLSQNIRSRLLEKLEIYFPSSFDDFLS